MRSNLRSGIFTSVFLASLALAAASAACSGTDSSSSPTADPTATKDPTQPAPGSPSEGGNPGAPSPGGDAGTPAPGAPKSATPQLRTTIDPAVAKILADAKIDLASVPADLGDLQSDDPKFLAVMKSFTVALGTNCFGCHAKGADGKIDKSVETDNMKIAAKMWSEYVVKLQTKAAAPIYCDSCHQGKSEFLDRTDEQALGGWMKSEFVDKLARKDGQAHKCSTCHGTPFVGPFLDGWKK